MGFDRGGARSALPLRRRCAGRQDLDLQGDRHRGAPRGRLPLALPAEEGPIQLRPARQHGPPEPPQADPGAGGARDRPDLHDDLRACRLREGPPDHGPDQQAQGAVRDPGRHLPGEPERRRSQPPDRQAGAEPAPWPPRLHLQDEPAVHRRGHGPQAAGQLQEARRASGAGGELMAVATRGGVGTPGDVDLEVLESVESRVLWLATSIVHHANKVRTTASGVKVGGHQASSASMVSIMTALFFEHMRAPDRVSVKPHASPVLHAINYLLGRLDPKYLTELRAFGGLQSYPSRAKDPDQVDFSTGSVGIGARSTICSSLAHRYVAGHFEVPVGGRNIALVGDAELDEDAIWEALVDPMVPRLGETLWIIDLNRQSLDRVVPDIAVGRIKSMFDAAGWRTITVKYGRRLRDLFEREGGESLRSRIDEMTNEEYQRLLRSPAGELRERLPGEGKGSRTIAKLISDVEDRDLLVAIRDLGGHDLADLRDAYREADSAHDQPCVIFAYTIKAWRLPTQGHPANHSALLSEEQWRELATELGADPDRPWATFDDGSPEAELCAGVAET